MRTIDERPRFPLGKVQDTCSTYRCNKPSGHGRTKRFCVDCAERLEAIGTQLQFEAGRIQRGGLDPSARNKAKNAAPPVRGKRQPTCCTVGCFEPRVPPDAFCDGCMSVGAVQELD